MSDQDHPRRKHGLAGYRQQTAIRPLLDTFESLTWCVYHISMPTKKHGATMYRDGCRCAVCKGAEAARQRRYRGRNPNAQLRGPRPNVVALTRATAPQQVQDGPGEVERAVRAQLDGNPKAQDRPGEAAAAIQLAKLLDDKNYHALAAQNSSRLHTILNSLGPAKRKMGSRLAKVESMTNRTPRARAQ